MCSLIVSLGKRCETNINECAPAPCANDGRCTDLINDYNCTCKPNTHGRHCEVVSTNCSYYNPCLSETSRTCGFDGKQYSCGCVAGMCVVQVYLIESSNFQLRHPQKIVSKSPPPPQKILSKFSSPQRSTNVKDSWVCGA